METWIEWGGFPRALRTSEPPIILSFFWSKILSWIQEKPSFKTNVCVPTRISGGDELTFSENSQPLLRILNYVVVCWSGREFYSICVCDVQINILFFVSIFWLISPILFLLCFRMKKKKKGGDVLHFCIFRLFQVIPDLTSTSVVGTRLSPHGEYIRAPTCRGVCGFLHAGSGGQREHPGSLSSQWGFDQAIMVQKTW